MIYTSKKQIQGLKNSEKKFYAVSSSHLSFSNQFTKKTETQICYLFLFLTPLSLVAISEKIV